VITTKASRLHRLTLHGNGYAYRQAGAGPVIVLIHGITSDSTNWAKVMPGLAERFTVIAPDLLGHGRSAKPTGGVTSSPQRRQGPLRVRGRVILASPVRREGDADVGGPAGSQARPANIFLGWSQLKSM
jgi:pimeloyl-ACP methyl ester carboxylesterase